MYDDIKKKAVDETYLRQLHWHCHHHNKHFVTVAVTDLVDLYVAGHSWQQLQM